MSAGEVCPLCHGAGSIQDGGVVEECPDCNGAGAVFPPSSVAGLAALRAGAHAAGLVVR